VHDYALTYLGARFRRMNPFSAFFSAFGDPEDGVDEETVVRGSHTGVAGLAWQEARDASPVFIGYLVATHG
jgi:hypothetical protein